MQDYNDNKPNGNRQGARRPAGGQQQGGQPRRRPANGQPQGTAKRRPVNGQGQAQGTAKRRSATDRGRRQEDSSVRARIRLRKPKGKRMQRKRSGRSHCLQWRFW